MRPGDLLAVTSETSPLIAVTGKADTIAVGKRNHEDGGGSTTWTATRTTPLVAARITKATVFEVRIDHMLIKYMKYTLTVYVNH